MQAQNSFSEKLKILFDQKILPVIFLLLLPPVVSELLYGSISISILLAIIPDIGLYGCGALMIRFLIVRRKLRNTSIILLGLSLAFLVEFLIKQTALSPLPGLTTQNPYGRVFNINIIYLIWALVYESVWGIYIPIKLFDLVYPSKKEDDLLGVLGFIMAGIGFLLGAYGSWFTWTQIAYPSYFNSAPFQPSYTSLGQGIIIAIILAYLALKNIKSDEKPKTTEPLPPVSLIGLTFFVISLSWFGLLLFAYNLFPTIPIVQPILFSIIMLVVASVGLFYWTRSEYWTDHTTLIVIFCTLLASMSAGIITNGISLPIDVLGKFIFDFIAIIGLVILYYMIEPDKVVSTGKKKRIPI